ncbi:hypothetical protein [Sulfuriferula sp.]|uniref:hypothetical protein n=1 Tax=Sulfuriferula sp. TaxID=2025307 RepID=UPI00272FF781|nr:hypothetical protein [Sulfuriferula sp.]MDP2025875.1 hypothetical protein [Sulfuriferula sp.]
MNDSFDHPDLHNALQLACKERISASRLGYWLRAHRDRIVSGIQLRQDGTDGHSKVTRWIVLNCG